MSTLFRIEFAKLAHLSSLRFSLILLALFPLVWAYAPGVFDVYGFYVVSGYQVPALALLSSMEFMLPLLVAIASAELLGLEMNYGTLKTILLRPVTRSRWIMVKLLVAAIYPFLLLAFFLLIALVAGVFFGFGEFIGGTGIGEGGVLGAGVMTPSAALMELIQAYMIAALSLVPISLLAILLTVLFMNAASGALATLAVIVFMHLLVVFPGLEPYLLTTQLSAYVSPMAGIVWVIALIGVYSFAFAALAVLFFERKDF